MLLKDIIMCKKDSDKIALKQSGTCLSYKRLFSIVAEKSSVISSYNCRSDNLGIFLPNSIQYILSYFTITLLDKTIVPISIQAKRAEVKSTVEYCDLGLIMTNTEYRPLLKEYLNDSEYKIVIFDIENESFDEVGYNEKTFKSISANKEVSENDVALMIHTSGTTSRPKRVMLTHKNLISNVKSIIQSFKLTEQDKTLISTPMIFAGGNTGQLLAHLFVGGSIVIMEGLFLPGTFLTYVQEERITNFFAVPPMLLMLLEYKEKLRYDISSLRYICFGGGVMSTDKIRQLIYAYPSVAFVHIYGQTEASPRISHLLKEHSITKLGSVGKPIPNVSVRIVNEKEQDVEVGEIGEIIVQGDNVMKGYYKRESETERTLKDGWLYTGDLGRFDEEGFIYLAGRKKNMVICGGINVYPEEIEELILGIPEVKEVFVTGEEDSMYGEVPVANVVLNEDVRAISESDIISFCMDNLAKHKVPSKVIFVNELDKTSTGKIKRK